MNQIILYLLLVIGASAQEYAIVTHPKDSKQDWGERPVVSLGDTNTLTNPSYRQIYWTVPTPAMWFGDVGVTITGSVQSAKSEARKLYRDSQPPEVKEARKMWRKGTRALLAAEGTPIGKNDVPTVSPAEFILRMGALTNTPTQARAWDMQNAVNSIQLMDSSPKPALTEDINQ